MNPQLERPDPLYMQVVARYRDLIKSGGLKDGERLPPVRDIADELGMAFNTVSKAMRVLANEGYVVTSKQGTFVSFMEHTTLTPHDRLQAATGRTKRIYPLSDRSQIVSSGLVAAPDYVAEAMEIKAGTPVIRRERVTMHGEDAVTFSTSWLPGELAEAVPELVGLDRLPGGTVGVIAERTGRRVDPDNDSYRETARRASEVVAERLGVDPGAPVLYGQNFWYDQDGDVLEFGEYYIPEGFWVTVSAR